MNFDEYQEKSSSTNVYSAAIDDLLKPIEDALPDDNLHVYHRLHEIREILNICYTLLGYAGEIGEILNSFKKVIRADKRLQDFKNEARAETGDSYWYGIGQLPTQMNMRADDIARENLEKLQDRKSRNALKGDGDER